MIGSNLLRFVTILSLVKVPKSNFLRKSFRIVFQHVKGLFNMDDEFDAKFDDELDDASNNEFEDLDEKLPVKLFIIEKHHNIDHVMSQGNNWPHLDIKMTKRDLRSNNKMLKIDQLGFAPADPTPMEIDNASQFWIVRKTQDPKSELISIYGWPKTDELREG